MTSKSEVSAARPRWVVAVPLVLGALVLLLWGRPEPAAPPAAAVTEGGVVVALPTSGWKPGGAPGL